MKTLGHTEEGNLLVEMTREEHYEFVLLAEAVEGATWNDTLARRSEAISGFDFSSVLSVIRAFTATKMIANELSRLVGHIHQALDTKKGVTEPDSEKQKELEFFKGADNV